jgi:hypothetical protein
MHRTILLIALTALFFPAAACGSSQAEERAVEAEEIEANAGNEATLVGDNPDDMDDWDEPNSEVETEMESAPYP